MGKKFFLYAFLIHIAMCQNVLAQEVSDLKLLYEIGNEKQVDYIFRAPQLLEIDSNENIYLVDYTGTEIMVFDETGAYKGKIGRKGRGPGDFLKITSLNVIENDTLIVFDAGNQRFSKIKNQQIVESFSSHDLDIGYLDVKKIWAYGNKFLIAMNTASHEGTDNKILFITNRNFSNLDKGLNSSLNIWNVRDEFTTSHTSAKDAVYVLTSDDYLFVTPVYYENYITKIDLENSKGIKLFTANEPSFKSYNTFDESDFNKRIPNKVLINKMGKRFVIQSINKSLGLFYENEFILHFFMMKINETNSGLFLNYFSEGNGFKKVVKLIEFDRHPINTFKILNYANGKVYTTGIEDRSVIEVYELSHNL